MLIKRIYTILNTNTLINITWILVFYEKQSKYTVDKLFNKSVLNGSKVMVENNKMKCEEEEVDSLDVFSQQSVVFMDSLEPAIKEKCENLVRFFLNTYQQLTLTECSYLLLLL